MRGRVIIEAVEGRPTPKPPMLRLRAFGRRHRLRHPPVAENCNGGAAGPVRPGDSYALAFPADHSARVRLLESEESMSGQAVRVEFLGDVRAASSHVDGV
jgi:hypothetical protein